MPPRMLIDTNVWLDYFIDRSKNHDVAVELIVKAIESGAELAVPIACVKDCFFLLMAELKRIERQEAGVLGDSAVLAIREVAWACISAMRKLAYVVPADEADMLQALAMRSEHPDFEDNLVIAAAMRVRADYLVTSDVQLLKHATFPCISPAAAFDVLAN